MIIRSAITEDANRIVELRLLNAHYHVELVSGGKLKPTTESFFEVDTSKKLIDPLSKVILGIENNIVVAYAIGCIGQSHPIFDFGEQAIIDDVFVSPDFQRHGYGNRLIEELFQWFKQNNIERIDLNVYNSNSKGGYFWENHGFDVFFKRMSKQV